MCAAGAASSLAPWSAAGSPGAGIFACPSERRQRCGLLRSLRGLSVLRIRLVGQLERLGFSRLVSSSTVCISAFWGSAIRRATLSFASDNLTQCDASSYCRSIQPDDTS